jgi:hypothetical protein
LQEVQNQFGENICEWVCCLDDRQLNPEGDRLIEELVAGIAEVFAGLWAVGDQFEFCGCAGDVDCAPDQASPYGGSVL